jgi:hypothetical protein
MMKDNHLVRRQAQTINDLEKKVAHYEKLLKVYSVKRKTRLKIVKFLWRL